MIPLKSYVADSLVGKQIHFKCDCVMDIDVVGEVRGWSIYNDEILWDIYTDSGKYIKIGENHPNMMIEEL